MAEDVQIRLHILHHAFCKVNIFRQSNGIDLTAHAGHFARVLASVRIRIGEGSAGGQDHPCSRSSSLGSIPMRSARSFHRPPYRQGQPRSVLVSAPRHRRQPPKVQRWRGLPSRSSPRIQSSGPPCVDRGSNRRRYRIGRPECRGQPYCCKRCTSWKFTSRQIVGWHQTSSFLYRMKYGAAQLGKSLHTSSS